MSMSLWCEEEEEEGQREDTPLRAPWDWSVTGERVLQRLLHMQHRYLPSAVYVSLVQGQPQQRDELAKWTLEVCCRHGCEEQVFPLTMSLLDRFLSLCPVLPQSPLCVAAACLLIASKLHQRESLSTQDLCSAAHEGVLPCSLREMERVVLATLQWDVAAVTPQDFLPHLLPAQVEKRAVIEDAQPFLSTLRYHSDTLVAMCVSDARFLGMLPSLVAAAALNSALRGLRNRSPLTGDVTASLAARCRSEQVVLHYYSEMIEGALLERLGADQTQTDRPKGMDRQAEEPRASTPTDLRDVEL